MIYVPEEYGLLDYKNKILLLNEFKAYGKFPPHMKRVGCIDNNNTKQQLSLPGLF